MKKATRFRPEEIRNVVLLGHGGAGKTTLAEAMLHRCGAISRMGSVTDGDTTADFEPEAKAHRHSTSSSLLFATYAGREVNVIDTPGHPELVGYALSALPAVETAIIVVSATAGVEFNTRRLFHAAGEAGLARMFVVNKIDAVSPAVLRGRADELKEAFGSTLHCMNLPTRGGKDVIDCFDQDAGQAEAPFPPRSSRRWRRACTTRWRPAPWRAAPFTTCGWYGKHHPVDSKDSAFRTAGKFAVRDAIAKARPVLLEPVVNLEVSVPEQFMGTITGDLKHVRGRVMGVESLPGGYAMVRTQAPLAELGGYAGHLCGSTGSFVMELSHDEPVPPQAQQKIVEARQARKAGAE
jgi:small GTP-binding protein